MSKIVSVILAMFCMSANASFERNAENTLLDFQGICLANIDSPQNIKATARKLKLRKAIGLEGVIAGWYTTAHNIAAYNDNGCSIMAAVLDPKLFNLYIKSKFHILSEQQGQNGLEYYALHRVLYYGKPTVVMIDGVVGHQRKMTRVTVVFPDKVSKLFP